MKRPSGDVKNDFYTEMNLERLKSSCSLFGLLMILLVVFLFLSAGLTAVLTSSRAKSKKINLKDLNFSTPANNFSAKEAEKTNLSGVVKIRVTEDELAAALKIKNPDFPLQNPELKIIPEKILIKGRSGKSFFSLRVEIEIIPAVADKKIFLKTGAVSAGGILAPKSLIDRISPKLSEVIKTDFAGQKGMEVSKIELYSGYAEIEGTIKQ